MSSYIPPGVLCVGTGPATQSLCCPRDRDQIGIPYLPDGLSVPIHRDVLNTVGQNGDSRVTSLSFLIVGTPLGSANYPYKDNSVLQWHGS